MGWFIQYYGDHKVLEHAGNIDGMSAQKALLPDADMAVVTLTKLEHSCRRSHFKEPVRYLHDQPGSHSAGGRPGKHRHFPAYKITGIIPNPANPVQKIEPGSLFPRPG